MAFLKTLPKRWAIRAYARKLPRLLLRDYGFSLSYTPQQVKTTIARNRMNSEYMCYAISMFSNRTAFDQYHRIEGESCDYDSMRSGVAATQLGGNTHFTIVDMLDASPHAFDAAGSHGAEGGHSHDYGDGGHSH